MRIILNRKGLYSTGVSSRFFRMGAWFTVYSWIKGSPLPIKTCRLGIWNVGDLVVEPHGRCQAGVAISPT